MFEPYSIVDAFTDRPFTGNPAGVVVRQEPADDAWMHRIAAEVGVSETAFLHPEGDAWRLRWFTPKTEVELCGHATLASAHVLWETGRVAGDVPIYFQTQSGLLTAERGKGKIALDFPARPVKEAAPPPGLCDALGAKPVWVGRWKRDWLVEVATAAEVRLLSPDHQALARTRVRAVMVTAAGDRGFDMVSRFFGPGVGVEEDPVTGAAHCALGPFWAARLGRTELSAWQASARGGSLEVGVLRDRVSLRGTAVTVARGEILGPTPGPVRPDVPVVQGLGGAFLYANDVDALAAWYSSTFGLVFQRWGDTRGVELPSADLAPDGRRATTTFALFRAETALPATRTGRVNFRVSSLDPLVKKLKKAGVRVERSTDDSFGRLAWCWDPEGNKLELWEPPTALAAR